MIVTPLALEILLQSYCSAAPFERHDTQPAKEARAMLFYNDMIDRQDEYCTATERGRFYIKHLLSVPFPIVDFRIPDAGDPA